ncbi:hypothetical protein Bbelb_143680 [Branchiostoma belcheri]|nr:hypothetical protein Bbelb_143680 [Branchiostoma belcheri]
MAGLARLVGPAASANLYAWTSDNGRAAAPGLPWPLDHHLPFYLVAVLSLLMAVLCASLPASINLPRAAPGKDSPTEELLNGWIVVRIEQLYLSIMDRPNGGIPVVTERSRRSLVYQAFDGRGEFNAFKVSWALFRRTLTTRPIIENFSTCH